MDTKQNSLRPKKRLGQHFLTDKNIIAKIIKAANLKDGERVLEIGPGRGALTTALLGAGADVVAIEFDGRLLELLEKKFGHTGRFRLVHADAVKIPFEDVLDGGDRVKVVANLPYNISGPILAKFTEKRALFNSMTLMLQKEVADRLLAEPSTKDYGALTIVIRAFMDVSRAFNVAPTCFTPPPKVDSTVISMTPRENTLVAPDMEVAFKRVVKGAFLQRRKTLQNSLKGADFAPDDLARAFEAAGISPTCRGETLTVAEFVRLTHALNP